MATQYLTTLSILATCTICGSETYELPLAPARLASWPPKVEQSGAFYQLLPQMYSDKVSIQETTFNGFNNVIYTVLEDALPPSWYPINPKVSINHLDATDALALSALTINPAIMQEALRIMPTTKAFERCDRSDPYSLKIDATQTAITLFNTIEGKINRCRLLKLFTLTGLVLLYKTNNSSLKVLRTVASWIINKTTFPFTSSDKVLDDNFVTTTPERLFDLSCATIKVSLAQRNQNQLLQDSLECYKLLLNSVTIAVNKEVIKRLLTKITNKLTLFDGARTCAAQYKMLADNL